jgi:hypothetical protein
LVLVVADEGSCCGSLLRLRTMPEPTKRRIMNNELTSQLSNGILSAIIALLFLAILSMLIGYRFITRELVKIGMKKGDAKALGRAVTVMTFLTLGAAYLKFFVLN